MTVGTGMYVKTIRMPHFPSLYSSSFMNLAVMLSKFFLQVAGVALAFGVLVESAGIKTGTTVQVNGIYYFVPPNAVSKLAVSAQQLEAASSGEDLIPLTVVTGDVTTFDTTRMRSIVNRYIRTDDVFSLGFLQGVGLKNISIYEAHISSHLSQVNYFGSTTGFFDAYPESVF
jgi:hypothetical protein